MRILLLLAPVAALLTACGDDPAGPDSGQDAAGGGTVQTQNDLLVEVDRGDGSAAESWTLTCLGNDTHPDAEAACAHLMGLEAPFAPLPADVVCTEQYGGPQTAHVTGRWDGEPVDLELSRTDGCHISQWDSLGPLLPGPVG